VNRPSYVARDGPQPDAAELLAERYGPTAGLVHEAIARPSPPPSREEPGVDAELLAERRQRLADAMQMGTGTYGQRRRDQHGRFRPVRR